MEFNWIEFAMHFIGDFHAIFVVMISGPAQ